MLDGFILAAADRPLSSVLIADAATGATALTLDWVGPFPADGGKVSINDVAYTYTAAADDGDDLHQILTLTAPGLTAPAVAGDEVTLMNGDQLLMQREAYVLVAGADEPIQAIVPHALLAFVPEGAEGDPASAYADPWPCTVTDGPFVELVNVNGRTPTTDATTLAGELPDTVTVPADLVKTDGQPPATAPDPQVYSAIGGLAIRLPPVDNADQVIVDVWVWPASAANPDFTTATPNGSIVMPPGAPALFPARDISGVKLTAGTSYKVRTQARDADGKGPLSTIVTGTPAVATGADVVVTADMLIANSALITALTVVDLATINLKSVYIDGGAILIASGTAIGVVEDQAFAGSALPSTWTGGSSGDANASLANPVSVTSTGAPAGVSGSALKLSHVGSYSSGLYRSAAISGAGNVLDFLLEARIAMSGDPWGSENSYLMFGARGGNLNTGLYGEGVSIRFVGSSWIVVAGANGSTQEVMSGSLSATGQMPLDTWYRVKLLVRGATVSVKVWPDNGSAEPANWTVGQLSMALGPGPMFARTTTVSSSINRTMWIDSMKLTAYPSGFRVNPDGTGAWPAVIDPLVAATAAVAARATALEKASTGNASATSPFATTMVLARAGNQVAVVAGSFTRATSFSTDWTQCGTIPVGYRPSSTVTLPPATIFGTTVGYQLRFNADGTVEARMSAANTGTMVAGGLGWPTTNAQP